MTNIYTDGCCLKNGKQDAIGGIGVFFGDNDNRNISKKLDGLKQTNNRAELMAVIEALKVKEISLPITIYTDSKYVQNGITTWIKNWKKNYWKTSTGKDVLNSDLWISLDLLVNKYSCNDLKFIHCKAHCGIYGNEEADRLAKNGTTNDF